MTSVRSRILRLCVTVAAACVLAGGGCPGTGIESQDDADSVAGSIYYQLTNAAPDYRDAKYNQTKVSGSEDGYVIVDGSVRIYEDYPEETTVYDVTFDCENYCTSEYYPHLTGDASMSGTITATTGGGSTYYTGSWTLSGTLALSGEYNGSVSITLVIERDGMDRHGTLTAEGKTWYVLYP